MKKILMTILCAMFFTFGMVFSANALTINQEYYQVDGIFLEPDFDRQAYSNDPGFEPYYIGENGPLDWWYGFDTSTSTIVDIIKTTDEELAWVEVYKIDIENQEIFNLTIDWTGGAERLLVKDGANIPAWYLFDISSWDGETNITLQNFWADRQGAISHVALYNGTQVPEPGMVILLGIGLIGLAFFSRRRLLN